MERENEVKICRVCPRRCRLEEGDTGFCKARICLDGRIRAKNYGLLTGLALDPIEKKPLHRFFPGSRILSIGSFGCNMDCPFCQNFEISRSDGVFEGSVQEGLALRLESREFTPGELCQIALQAAEEDGNIGIAYTYNEPLVGYEFVLDTAKLIHGKGLKNVLVTNGCVNLSILEEVLPFIDAMNVDLKCFTDKGYRSLGGDLDTVKSFIRRAAEESHVELTTLIVPGLSDSEEDMEREAEWIASVNPEIPLHLSRYFPRYRSHEPATDISVMRKLKEIAEGSLKTVILGNI
ncbi:MAG: AmmeMemoRadiSam system radical SAM enzyme [Lachnospiraceae bacterium]|nr:AmmeMemoRadiSam system radical SAM enzyme [Lachnospiraceae bacterium]